MGELGRCAVVPGGNSTPAVPCSFMSAFAAAATRAVMRSEPFDSRTTSLLSSAPMRIVAPVVLPPTCTTLEPTSKVGFPETPSPFVIVTLLAVPVSVLTAAVPVPVLAIIPFELSAAIAVRSESRDCLLSSCVCAFDERVLMYWNSVLVTLPSAILVASIPAADLISLLSILVIVFVSASIDLPVSVCALLAVVTAAPPTVALVATSAPIVAVPVTVMLVNDALVP